MNFSKSLMALALTGLLFISCKKNEVDQAKNTAKSTAIKKEISSVVKLEIVTFNIEGMTCAIGCAKTIQDKLATMDGVQKATVDFDKKVARVEFDATKQTPEKLLKAVETIGDGKTYKVSNMKS